jgi:hypothetical protein
MNPTSVAEQNPAKETNIYIKVNTARTTPVMLANLIFFSAIV